MRHPRTAAAALLGFAVTLAAPAQAEPRVDDAPVLALQAPELLGRTKLALVPGVWTVLTVDVDNSGTATADDVVLTGSGRGLKVRPVAVGSVITDFSAEARVEVRLTKKRASALTLTVTSGGYAASTTATVRPAAAPTRPQPGRYRSKDGDVEFTITGGKPRVTDFDAQVGATCGTFPQFTYPTQPVGFPTTPVGRNGIVDVVSDSDRIYRELALKVVGGRVTSGRIYFNGAGVCYGSETFTAKRVGRR